MKNIIAERKLLFALKGSSERNELNIRIGNPYWDTDGMAACPVEMDGLFNQYGPIKGIDFLHALSLASNVEPLLNKLHKKYDFFWPDGEPYHDAEDNDC